MRITRREALLGGTAALLSVPTKRAEATLLMDDQLFSAAAAAACDTYFNNTVLLLSGDGTNGSTTFTDESSKLRGNATVDSVTVSTAQFKFGTGSIAGGAGGTRRITYPNSADFWFGSGTFTIEGWIRLNSIVGTQFVVCVWDNTPTLSWAVLVSSGKLSWNVSTTGSDNLNDLLSTTTLSTGTWYHWAIDYDGVKYRMYINGIMEASSATPRTIFNNTTNVLAIGNNSAGSFGGFVLDGYVDEPRITKGVGRYASNAGFAVPTAAYPRAACGAACDNVWANTVLLMGFEGSNGATGAPGMTDESFAANGTAVVTGNAQITTAQSKFGGSSAVFDGAGDYLTYSARAAWGLGTVWTIECFVRFNASTVDQCVMGQFIGAGSRGWMFRTQASNSLQFFTYDGSVFPISLTSAASAYVTGQWYHICGECDGTKARFYINGVMVASSSPSDKAAADFTVPLTIGADGLTGRNLNGWVDEIRITKGYARYASDSPFTVPAAAFPRTNTGCSTVLDGLSPTLALSCSRRLLSTYVGPSFRTVTAGVIPRIFDQSGNVRDATSSSTFQPADTTAGPNSRACAAFDGIDDTMTTSLTLASFITASTGYMIASIYIDAFTTNNATLYQNAIIMGDGGSGWARMTERTGNLFYCFNWDGNADVATGTVNLTTPTIVEWRHEGGLIYQRVNGANETSVASGNTANVGSGSLVIGGLAGTSFMQGKIFEVATFAVVPTQVQRDAIVHDFGTWIGASVP